MITFLLLLTDHNNWVSSPWWLYIFGVVLDFLILTYQAEKL